MEQPIRWGGEATDTDDLIVGRKNADEKMYKESVAYGDDLDHSADDIVDGSYDFRLKLHPGKWQEGKSGTIRITFKNVIHTKNNELFPFYRTIDLQMVSEVTSYTTSGQPLFHLYPVRFDNRMFAVETIYGESSKGYQASIADAEAVCANIGGGWRLPTVSELLMSYVYSNALGVVQRIIVMLMVRIYMGGIKTGLLIGKIITGLHHTMRLMAPIYVSDLTFKTDMAGNR